MVYRHCNAFGNLFQFCIPCGTQTHKELSEWTRTRQGAPCFLTTTRIANTSVPNRVSNCPLVFTSCPLSDG
ncbi:hypothetical protein BLOT_011876 [Blomia tropicalis]|nr:hypothetical protein BLOT_011876 [Blomia tropicalis]